MGSHASVLAWRIAWTEEPGGLRSMGSHRIGRDYSDLAHNASTPVSNQVLSTVRCVTLGVPS